MYQVKHPNTNQVFVKIGHTIHDPVARYKDYIKQYNLDSPQDSLIHSDKISNSANAESIIHKEFTEQGFTNIRDNHTGMQEVFQAPDRFYTYQQAVTLFKELTDSNTHKASSFETNYQDQSKLSREERVKIQMEKNRKKQSEYALKEEQESIELEAFERELYQEDYEELRTLTYQEEQDKILKEKAEELIHVNKRQAIREEKQKKHQEWEEKQSKLIPTIFNIIRINRNYSKLIHNYKLRKPNPFSCISKEDENERNAQLDIELMKKWENFKGLTIASLFIAPFIALPLYLLS